MCLSSKPSKPSRSIREIEADDEAFLGAIDSDKAWETRVFLAGVPLTMKIDTGADVTAMVYSGHALHVYAAIFSSSEPRHTSSSRTGWSHSRRRGLIEHFPLTHLVGRFFFSAHGLRGSWPQGPSSRTTCDYSPTRLASARYR